MNSQTHPYNDPFATPGAQHAPTWSARLRNSKALIPTIAVLGVAVLALAATLVAKRSDALPGGGQEQAAITAPAPVVAPVVSPAKPVVTARAPVTAPVVRTSPEPRYTAAVCTTCGTVESVVTVKRDAEKGTGLGAVAGGVAGALLGNQVGGGNGRTAMTVLGAAGGAYGGNVIEKKMKGTTYYQMRVRMEDGTYRTFEQSSPIATGSRVVVEGSTVRAA